MKKNQFVNEDGVFETGHRQSGGADTVSIEFEQNDSFGLLTASAEPIGHYRLRGLLLRLFT